MVLYGVGVGPGDPELLTVKAVKVISQAKHIFVASKESGGSSVALSIAGRFIPDDTPCECLAFPMTRDGERLQDAWMRNAERVASVLRESSPVVYLTMGDPSIYSTFGYLARAVKKILPGVFIETVPGITAAQAAASKIGVTLVEEDESLVVVSGVSAGEVEKLLGVKGTLVVYKVYRNAKEILGLLKRKGRLKETRAVSMCGLPGEEVLEDPEVLSSKKVHYFTLVVVGGKSYG